MFTPAAASRGENDSGAKRNPSKQTMSPVSTAPARPKRNQVAKACDWCRAHRIKCNSGYPCDNCRIRGGLCNNNTNEVQTLPHAIRSVQHRFLTKVNVWN